MSVVMPSLFLLLIGTPDAAAQSCVGYCDEQTPAGCWCDDQCETYGDCCDDYLAVCVVEPGTCAGACDGQSAGGCWCDSLCSLYGDCCTDVQEVCLDARCDYWTQRLDPADLPICI